jgi:hypothetical protein
MHERRLWRLTPRRRNPYPSCHLALVVSLRLWLSRYEIHGLLLARHRGPSPINRERSGAHLHQTFNSTFSAPKREFTKPWNCESSEVPSHEISIVSSSPTLSLSSSAFRANLTSTISYIFLLPLVRRTTQYFLPNCLFYKLCGVYHGYH